MQTKPIDDTYADVERLIYFSVRKFQRRFGGDFDHYLSEANLIFLKVYNKEIDPAKGTFSTLLCHSIYKQLLNKMPDRRYKVFSLDEKTRDGTSYANTVADTSRAFDLEGFCEDLSEDAATVLKLVLDAPTELADIAMGKGDSPCNWRSTVRNYLRQMGWPTGRITETFDEIKGALSCT